VRDIGPRDRVKLGETLQRLIEALPLPLLVVDRSTYILGFNARAAALFGLDERRARGRALIEAVPSIELERLISRAAAGEGIEETVSMLVGSQQRAIAVNAFALPAGDGRVVVAGEDRTAAANAVKLQSEYVADISHELRTPISALRLMVETIQLSAGDAETVKMFLPKIAAEIGRMAELVEDLLDLARSESAYFPLNLTEADLGALVEEAVDSLRPRAEAAGIELSCSVQTAVGEVDPHRVAQVVTNLVDNALRHTPRDGHVRVRLSRGDGEAALVVEDDGEGIPFKDLPRVFDRFYVVDRSRARERGGTGLGLAIVKQIVEAHGGFARADSELGVGSRFSCTFPARTKIKAP
jgi:two-component system phosphate regulon sensor histidine kinase PhoR